jgi:thioesterase domain-containing protein
LEQYNRLPKEERDRLRERYEQFSHLTPARQDLVRRQMKRFAEMPAERRRVLSRELVRLRRASDEDRRARINSEEFRSRYTLQEQQMLQDLSENLTIRPQVAEASNFTGK